MIRGFPIEHKLPRTPYDGVMDSKTISLSLACHLGIYNILGINPVAYQNENNERLVRNVVPSQSGEYEKSSHGSALKFGMHVDNPDLALIPEKLDSLCGAPEFLSLYSLRCDNRASTDLIELDVVLNNLPAGAINSLRKLLYSVRQPDSFTGEHHGIHLGRLHAPYFNGFNSHRIYSRSSRQYCWRGRRYFSPFIHASGTPPPNLH